jgi:hypothetical protein
LTPKSHSKNTNKLGEITAGRLRLRALVVPVRIVEMRDTESPPLYRVVRENIPHSDRPESASDSDKSWVTLDIDDNEEATNFDANERTLYCLSLLSNQEYALGLVLKCVQAATIPATYERAGTFMLLHIELWQGVVELEIVLI